MKSPCKDCLNREIGCHSVCSEYIEFSEGCEAIRELRHREIESRCFTNSMIKKSIKKLNGGI